MSQQQRTWDHRRGIRMDLDGAGGLLALACGCRVDYMDGGTWEPCRAHEGQGHLSAISEQDGAWIACCLVGRCGWRVTLAYEWLAQDAAVSHWNNTAQR
jgi:hypothetical protein